MGRFVVDKQRSHLTIAGSSSVHPIHLESRALEGEIDFADGVGTGRLVIPVNSLRSGQLLQDLELRRQINARRHPTISADVTRLTPDRAEGNVTFFGTTVAASGPLRVEQTDDELHITGEATFDVTAFGFRPPNILGVRVHNEVTATIEVVAVRQ